MRSSPERARSKAGPRCFRPLEPERQAEGLLEVRAAAAVLLDIEPRAQLAAQGNAIRHVYAHAAREGDRVAREAVAAILAVIVDVEARGHADIRTHRSDQCLRLHARG